MRVAVQDHNIKEGFDHLIEDLAQGYFIVFCVSTLQHDI
jgi:hypothetical protein